MTDNQTHVKPSKFIGMPITALGLLSNYLSLFSVIIFIIWVGSSAAPPIPSLFTQALIVFGFPITATAASVVGILAVIRERERSFAIYLTITFGVLVLSFCLANSHIYIDVLRRLTGR